MISQPSYRRVESTVSFLDGDFEVARNTRGLPKATTKGERSLSCTNAHCLADWKKDNGGILVAHVSGIKDACEIDGDHWNE